MDQQQITHKEQKIAIRMRAIISLLVLIIILTQSCAVKQKKITGLNYDDKIHSVLKEIIGEKRKDTAKIEDYFIKKNEVLTYLENSKKFNELMGHCIENNKVIYFDSVFNFNEREQLVLKFKEKNYKRKINHKILEGLKTKLVKSTYKNKRVRLMSPIITNNTALVYLDYPEESEVLIILKKMKESWELVYRKH